MNRRKAWRQWAVLAMVSGLLANCTSPADLPSAVDVAGQYQLIEYRNGSLMDTNPSGTINAVQADDRHVNIQVQGMTGTRKVVYNYLNVVVVDAPEVIAGQDAYNLLYKGKQIGVAGNDAISRYMDLMPSSTVTLKAVEF